MLWKAAEIAERTLHELIDIIDREGIPYDYDVDATRLGILWFFEKLYGKRKR